MFITVNKKHAYWERENGDDRHSVFRNGHWRHRARLFDWFLCRSAHLPLGQLASLTADTTRIGSHHERCRNWRRVMGEMTTSDATRCAVCGGPFAAMRVLIDGKVYHERCSYMSYPSHTHEDYARASAEIERLRAALEEIAKHSDFDEWSLEFYPSAAARLARAALKAGDAS